MIQSLVVSGSTKTVEICAVVVAQLVERSLPTPEVRESNPVIGKLYIECLLPTVLRRQKLRKRGWALPVIKLLQVICFTDCA